MRIAVFVLEIIVVLLSFLVGSGALSGPAIVRAALAFFALFVVPGFSLSSLVFRSRAALAETGCRVFSMGLCFVSAVVCAGFLPGVSYRALSCAATVSALGIAFFAMIVRAAPGEESSGHGDGSAVRIFLRSRVGAAILCGVLFAACVAAFADSGELGWSTDSLDHVSFVRRSVDSGVLFPRDSFHREGDGISFDPRKGLWHPVLSLWTYQAHAPADRVWRAAPGFLSYFAFCAFIFFAMKLCGTARCAALSFAFFLVFYAGEGVAWITKIGFSRNIAQVVLWMNLAFLLEHLRTGTRAHLFASVLCACVGTAIHVVFAMLLGVSLAGVFLFVALFPGGIPWRGAFRRSVPLQLAAMAFPLAVRAPGAFVPSNSIHTHMQGMLVLSSNLAIVDPAELLMRYGLIFFFIMLAVPFFPWIAERSERRGLAFMLGIVPAVLVLDPLIAPILERRIGYLHYRILDAAPLVVMLSLLASGLVVRLVRGGTAAGGGGGRPPSMHIVRGAAHRIAAGALLALFIAYPLRTASIAVAGSLRSLATKEPSMPPSYASLFEALDATVPAHSVIAGDPMTSYALSAYTDHFVTVVLDQHCSPADTGAIERLREARNLLSAAMPLSASRPWLDRTSADYVLINENIPETADFFNSFLTGDAPRIRGKFLACPSACEPVFDRDGFLLLRLKGDSPEEFADEGCASAQSGAVPCGQRGEVEEPEGAMVERGTDIGEGIALVSLAVDNYLLGPGDTIAGHLCWEARQDQRFGLPHDVIIRIDAPFPKGALHRDWYGKQYRRIVERRRGEFYRVTWRMRLMSGSAYPDMLGEGRVARQDFALPLPVSIARGPFEVRIKVLRAPYLENRRPADYLSNDDSFQGVPVGMIYLSERSRVGAPGRPYPGSIRRPAR